MTGLYHALTLSVLLSAAGLFVAGAYVTLLRNLAPGECPSMLRAALWFLAALAAALLLLFAAGPGSAAGGCATSYSSYSYAAAPSYSYYAPPAQIQKVVERVVVKKEAVPVAVYVPVFSAIYQPPCPDKEAAPKATMPPAAAPEVPPGEAKPAAPAQMPAPVPAPMPNGELKQILNILQGFDARLRVLEERAGQPPPGTLPPLQAPVPPAPIPTKPPGQAVTAPLPAATPSPEPPAAPPPAAAKTTPQAKAAEGAAIVQARCMVCHNNVDAPKKGGKFSMGARGHLLKLTDRQARKAMSRAYDGSMPPPDSGVAPLTDAEVGAVLAYMGSMR